MDDVDREIIRLLQRDGRSSNTEIGRALGLTETTIRKRIARLLVSQPEVRYVGYSTGRYDLIVEAFFSDHEHLLDFVSTTLGAMPGVTTVETSLILKVAKFSYEWEIA